MLKRDDIQVLIEALDAWEVKKSSDGMFASFVSLALCPEEKRDEFKRKDDEYQRKTQQETAIRKERSTIIKAKLIEMRNQMMIEDEINLAQCIEKPE